MAIARARALGKYGIWPGVNLAHDIGVTILDSGDTWRIHDGAETALLIDGRDYYRAFYVAATQAKKSILLLGWQFDSDVELLRGEDIPSGMTRADVQLLLVLERLSLANPELEIRVLAWDHSLLFALERELLQKLYFDAINSDRFVFRWDDTVPFGGSHHQKVAIIDGEVAFFGSQDICQARWDDSSHQLDNPLRVSRGEPNQPYHEVQVAVHGDAAQSMLDLFVWRWFGATGEKLDVQSLTRNADEAASAEPIKYPVTVAMPPARLGLARTIPEVTGRQHINEVSKVYVRAIEQAEHSIYIESQYLTSCAVRDALIARMQDASKPKLNIVIVLPHKPEKFKEEMTIGVPQALLQQTLHQAAAESGHALGIYTVVAGVREVDEGVFGVERREEPVYVYIHSKLMIVDDRIFLVGSANLTNRSMTIDSEIVAAYEALPEDASLRDAIRAVRERLLTEHIGNAAAAKTFDREGAWVAQLNALVTANTTRLRHHEVAEDEPSAFARTVHELTLEFLDPADGANGSSESCPPASSVA